MAHDHASQTRTITLMGYTPETLISASNEAPCMGSKPDQQPHLTLATTGV